MKRVTVVIPCYNEADGIGKVIDAFPRKLMKRYGYLLDVLVVDNNSSDNTSAVARRHGASVIFEPKQGKGNAIKTGFASVDSRTDYVVMLDGDDTYRPEEIVRLLEPLDSGFCEVVIGSRLGGKISQGSMTWLNRLGNWIFSHLVRYVYRVNVTDVLTGYFAWRREVIEELHPHLQSKGFAIEMEMITKMARLGHDIYSVPISYHSRAGESSLNPIADGAKILKMFTQNLLWKPRSAVASYPSDLSHLEENHIFGEQIFDGEEPSGSLKIAIVSDAVYPYSKGGKEVRFYQLSNRLAQMGHDVTIYSMKWWEGENEIYVKDVRFKAISPLIPLYKGERRSIKQGILFALHCFKLLFEDFDVIDVDHMPFFPLYPVKVVAFLKRKKMIATWHEVWGREYWVEYLGKAGLIAYVIEKLSVNLPDHIVAVSETTAQKLHDVLGYNKQVTVIPNGIDRRSIAKVKPAAEKTDIIYAGRLLKHKNVDLLLDAVKILKKDNPRVRCLIIGQGPERDALIAKAAVLNIEENVSFKGFLPRQGQVFSYIKASRVFASPSTREGFGMTVLEANACGLPVVTIDHPANAARDLIIPHKNGLLSKPEAKDLARQLAKVLDGKWNRDEVTEQAHLFNWQAAADKSNEVLSV